MFVRVKSNIASLQLTVEFLHDFIVFSLIKNCVGEAVCTGSLAGFKNLPLKLFMKLSLLHSDSERVHEVVLVLVHFATVLNKNP